MHSHTEALAGGLDFAVICNPTSLHVETAQLYVQARVPVLIEKPLGHQFQDARQLAEQAADHGVQASMAYCMRYHPAYNRAREVVRGGILGRPLYAKAWFEAYLPNWHPWEDYRNSYAARRDLGGGALLTLDHEIDFLNWTLGTAESAVGVSASTGALDADAEDNAAIVASYATGVVASIQLSLCRKDPSRGFEFVCEDGSISYRSEDSQLIRTEDHGRRRTVIESLAEYDIGQMYRDLAEEFVANLLEAVPRDARLAPITAGLETLRICSMVNSHTANAGNYRRKRA